jgi:hypothetical protein
MKVYLNLVLAFFLVVTLGIVSASPEEYLHEFSNNNETCEVIDYFVYDYSCPWFFNSDRLCSTVPTFYRCCTNDKCTTVIFDLQSKKFFRDSSSVELIDLNYIKYSLRNGNISQTQFQLTGFDVCSYFGSKEIKQESVNLAASAAESISPLVLEAERAKNVKNLVQNARKIGIVSKFNPSTLVAGFTCNYNSKKLNIAVESLANTNAYLSNINNNYAREGYISGLSSEIDIARTNLKSYVESPVSMIRGTTNWLANVFVWLFNLSSHPGKIPEGIPKTEYQVAQDAYAQVNSYNLYIHNPNNANILVAQNSRISEKNSSFIYEYNIFNKEYQEVKKIKPSFLTVLFTDVFKNPNYNLSYGNSFFKEASRLKDSGERNYHLNKFNSAIENISNAGSYLNLSQEIYLREQGVKRNYSIWPFFIIAFLIALSYFGYKNYLTEY